MAMHDCKTDPYIAGVECAERNDDPKKALRKALRGGKRNSDLRREWIELFNKGYADGIGGRSAVAARSGGVTRGRE